MHQSLILDIDFTSKKRQFHHIPYAYEIRLKFSNVTKKAKNLLKGVNKSKLFIKKAISYIILDDGHMHTPFFIIYSYKQYAQS